MNILDRALNALHQTGYKVHEAKRTTNLDFDTLYAVKDLATGVRYGSYKKTIRLMRRVGFTLASQIDEIPENHTIQILPEGAVFIPNTLEDRLQPVDEDLNPHNEKVTELLRQRSLKAREILFDYFPGYNLDLLAMPHDKRHNLITVYKHHFRMILSIKLYFSKDWYIKPFHGNGKWLVKDIIDTSFDDETNSTVYKTNAWDKTELIKSQGDFTPTKLKYFAVLGKNVGVGNTRNVAISAVRTRIKNQVSTVVWED